MRHQRIPEVLRTAVLASAVLAAGGVAPSPLAIANGPGDVSSSGSVSGDVNCSGGVDAIDAALVLQYTAGLTGSLPCLGSGDVNANGSVDAVDAALILQFVAGLIPPVSM